MSDFLTVSQLRVALAALPPEYDDVEVSLNHEYGATAVEPIDHGKEQVVPQDDGTVVRYPRYGLDVNGY